MHFHATGPSCTIDGFGRIANQIKKYLAQHRLVSGNSRKFSFHFETDSGKGRRYFHFFQTLAHQIFQIDGGDIEIDRPRKREKIIHDPLQKLDLFLHGSQIAARLLTNLVFHQLEIA